MARDLGVHPDYVDRAFRSMETIGWTSKGSAAQKAANKRSVKVAVRKLSNLQAARPLRPPCR